MIVTVDVHGLKGVEDALAQAGPKLAKRALRRALKKGADVLTAEAKRRAPVASGALRDAIAAVVRLTPKQEAGRARVGLRYTGKGSQDAAVYARFAEFGTKNQPARPFLRPAFDAGNRLALDAFTEVLKSEVDGLSR